MKIAEAANDVIEGYAIMGKRPFKVRRFSQIAGKLWMGGFPVGQAPEDLQFVVNLHPAIGYGMHPKQILTCAIFMDGEELPEEKLLYLLARHVNECRQHGTTLVLVTHDEMLARRCTRQIRLAGGRVVGG